MILVQVLKTAGFTIGRAGMITCNEKLLMAMERLLTKVIRSEKQLRSLISSIMQAHSGFRFDVHQISEFGTEIANLQRAFKSAQWGCQLVPCLRSLC